MCCPKGCYTKPLKLEGGTQGTFLETTFEVKNNDVKWWLKNANADGDTRVWRYQHFYSYGSYQQKRALLRACLTKVQNMASGENTLQMSAAAKLKEFAALAYPRWMQKAACSYVAERTGERTWLRIRREM